jgi:hypothetical protein
MTVKTLQDRPHLLANRLTTVKYLVTPRPPSSLPPTRLTFERHVFTVVTRVTFVREDRLRAQARRAAKTCARARVTGVVFFDFDHGQTGVAPNAIELHPILALPTQATGAPSLF